MPHYSPNTPHHAAAALAFALSMLAGPPAIAQADNSASNLQAAWRATSRLGYGPTAATAQAAETDPKAWALQQIDAAYTASQSAPIIPAEIARFNEPVNDIARDFRAERQARRTTREQSATPTAAPIANTSNQVNPAVLVVKATDAEASAARCSKAPRHGDSCPAATRPWRTRCWRA